MPNLVRADFISDASGLSVSDSKVIGALGGGSGTHHLELQVSASGSAARKFFLATNYSQADIGIGFGKAASLIVNIKNQGGSLVLRWQNANNYYEARFGAVSQNTNNQFTIEKVVSGVITVLASTTSSSMATPRAMRFMILGSDIQLDLDTGGGLVSILTASDSGIAAAGLPGFGYNMIANLTDQNDKLGFDNGRLFNVS